MFRMTWKKGGSSVVCIGMRNTVTGVLRGLTQAEVDEVMAKFEGKDKLEEPFATSPFVPEGA